MAHTNPYHPPQVADSQTQLANQAFARRAPASASAPPGTTYTSAASAPVGPIAGDRWFNTALGIMFTYINDGNSSQWVEV
jgi:hypothetical protein